MYIPALNGLRGIAALLVMFFHYFLLDFGWVGVQLFFVLSSFLITGILAREREVSTGNYLKTFYGRRCLRIFPLYYTFFAIILLIDAISGLPPNVMAIWWWGVTHTYNLGLAVNTGLSNFFLTHIWSLNVEEQYYLLWPVLIYFLPARWLPRLLWACLLLAPALRAATHIVATQVWDVTDPAVSVYVMPLSYLDAFAAGGLVALGHFRCCRRKLLAYTAIAIAAGLINAYMLASSPVVLRADLGYPIYMSAGFQYIWGYTILSLLFAALIGSVVTHRGDYRWLEFGALEYLGKISFGLYLLHRPVVALALWLVGASGLDLKPYDLSFAALCVALTIGIAALSYRYLEYPITRRKHRWFPYDRGTQPVVAK
jgi:peptidoglycan/LPS O-acetylase OafA/YrhL